MTNRKRDERCAATDGFAERNELLVFAVEVLDDEFNHERAAGGGLCSRGGRVDVEIFSPGSYDG